MTKAMENKKVLVINDYCEYRIKPKLIRDVKTEAVLVFARTALERFFNKLDMENINLSIGNKENTEYIYGKLRGFLNDLKKHVVNVEYLIELVQNAKKFPNSTELRQLAKYEEPLITYYDSMAKRMEYHFPSKTTVVPEFIVVCVLCNWFIEDEHPTTIYPFIKDYDFLKIIEKFEQYAINETDDKRKLFLDMQKISIDVADTLKRTKYKFNKERTSKRKKR